MYGRIILAVAISAFVILQLAQAQLNNVTKCYRCDSPESCETPIMEICNETSANRTRDQLKDIFKSVSDITITKFQCLSVSHSYVNLTKTTIAGCINAGVNTCTLAPLNITSTLKDCRTCDANLCNFASELIIVPSSATAITFPSVLISGLIMAKMFLI